MAYAEVAIHLSSAGQKIDLSGGENDESSSTTTTTVFGGGYAIPSFAQSNVVTRNLFVVWYVRHARRARALELLDHRCSRTHDHA